MCTRMYICVHACAYACTYMYTCIRAGGTHTHSLSLTHTLSLSHTHTLHTHVGLNPKFWTYPQALHVYPAQMQSCINMCAGVTWELRATLSRSPFLSLSLSLSRSLARSLARSLSQCVQVYVVGLAYDYCVGYTALGEMRVFVCVCVCVCHSGTRVRLFRRIYSAKWMCTCTFLSPALSPPPPPPAPPPFPLSVCACTYRVYICVFVCVCVCVCVFMPACLKA
jgi:hypothetical protein